jgi:hypothetical protein
MEGTKARHELHSQRLPLQVRKCSLLDPFFVARDVGFDTGLKPATHPALITLLTIELSIQSSHSTYTRALMSACVVK